MLNKFVLNPVVLFPVNVAIMLLLVLITDKFILNAEFYQKEINNTGLDLNAVLINTDPRLKLLLYTVSALLLFLKYAMISVLIYTTFYLDVIKVSFLSIFKIVCFSEMVFLIPAIIKVIWFITYPPLALYQWTQFYPLSIHSIFSGAYIPAVITYPLQLLNAFELIYILILACLLQKLLKKDFDYMMKIVLISYLPGLFVWALIATYYTVMLYQN